MSQTIWFEDVFECVRRRLPQYDPVHIWDILDAYFIAYNHAVDSGTVRYVEEHPLEEIKYHIEINDGVFNYPPEMVYDIVRAHNNCLSMV